MCGEEILDDTRHIGQSRLGYNSYVVKVVSGKCLLGQIVLGQIDMGRCLVPGCGGGGLMLNKLRVLYMFLHRESRADCTGIAVSRRNSRHAKGKYSLINTAWCTNCRRLLHSRRRWVSRTSTSLGCTRASLPSVADKDDDRCHNNKAKCSRYYDYPHGAWFYPRTSLFWRCIVLRCGSFCAWLLACRKNSNLE